MLISVHLGDALFGYEGLIACCALYKSLRTNECEQEQRSIWGTNTRRTNKIFHRNSSIPSRSMISSRIGICRTSSPLRSPKCPDAVSGGRLGERCSIIGHLRDRKTHSYPMPSIVSPKNKVHIHPRDGLLVFLRGSRRSLARLSTLMQLSTNLLSSEYRSSDTLSSHKTDQGRKVALL